MVLTEMTMPKMGESVMECTIISILKKVGDRVEADDSVLEVATDKVDTEVPSPVDGVIQEILVKEGDVVAIGSVVMRLDIGAVVETEGVEPSSTPENTEAAQLEQRLSSITQMANAVLERPLSAPLVANGTRFYSPLVLTIAKTEGISTDELEAMVGTGAEGRVTKHDILGYLKGKEQGVQPTRNGTQKAEQETGNLGGASTAGSHPNHSKNAEVIPMDRLRRVIAERMLDSQRISAHVTSYVECDMTNIVKWREHNKDQFRKQTGEGITFTPILIEAVVKAIKDFPLINISVDGDHIIKKRDINIGMAVALPSGNLIVPVIHNADQYSLIGLAKKVNDLANRARNNKLTADDLAGGTYTISNIGSFGNIMGTPIIVQPQVAIMAFGAIQKKPVVIETPQGDVFGVRSMMYLSHSYDHRVVDGALGGLFVKRVSDHLERFEIDRKLF